MKKLFARQRGFTIIELAIGIAIASIIGFGIIAAIFQIYRINNTASARVIAVKQVENALHYLIRDAQMEQNLTENNTHSFHSENITFTWITWEDNVQHQVTYKLDGEGNLTRDDGTTTATVARYIDADNSTWTYNSSTNKVTIMITATAHVGNRQFSETRKVEILPRVGS